MGRLDGKVALITGGARGMGKSHARHFVAEGARVVIGDVLDDKGGVVAGKLGDGGLPVRAPRRDQRSRLGRRGGRRPWTPSAASTSWSTTPASCSTRTIAEMPLAEFRQVLDVNLVGCWLGIKAVIAPMTAAGGGSIVNISSIEGFAGAAGLSAYSASKFGIRGVTKAAAQELGQFGIRVNSVHPGGVMTRWRSEPREVVHRRRPDRRSSRACRSPGSPSRSRSPGWSRSSPPTSRRTPPAPSSSPTAACSAAPATDGSPRWTTVGLDGKVAVVTGAGDGLGRAEALALAAAGARLVLNDLPGDALHAVADEIRAAGGEAVVCAGDVGEWATGQALLAAALDAYGRLDILVNNAGVLRDRMVFSMSREEWDLVMRVHLRGHFVTTRFATAYWRERSKADRRAGVRPDRQHLLRGVPARLGRASRTTPPPRPASSR